MNKIVVIRISPLRDYITIGFFGEQGDSKMQIVLSAKLFPEGIKQGDEVVFTKRANILEITRS